MALLRFVAATLLGMIALSWNPVESFSVSSTTSAGKAKSTQLMAVDTSIAVSELVSTVTFVGAGVALVAAGAAAIISNLKDSDDENSTVEAAAEPEPEHIYVPIPYDAASRLAYDTWAADKDGFNQAGYDAFKGVYESMTVASVTQKKYARDAEMWEAELAKLKNE